MVGKGGVVASHLNTVMQDKTSHILEPFLGPPQWKEALNAQHTSKLTMSLSAALQCQQHLVEGATVDATALLEIARDEEVDVHFEGVEYADVCCDMTRINRPREDVQPVLKSIHQPNIKGSVALAELMKHNEACVQFNSVINGKHTEHSTWQSFPYRGPVKFFSLHRQYRAWVVTRIYSARTCDIHVKNKGAVRAAIKASATTPTGTEPSLELKFAREGTTTFDFKWNNQNTRPIVFAYQCDEYRGKAKSQKDTGGLLERYKADPTHQSMGPESDDEDFVEFENHKSPFDPVACEESDYDEDRSNAESEE